MPRGGERVLQRPVGRIPVKQFAGFFIPRTFRIRQAGSRLKTANFTPYALSVGIHAGGAFRGLLGPGDDANLASQLHSQRRTLDSAANYLPNIVRFQQRFFKIDVHILLRTVIFLNKKPFDHKRARRSQPQSRIYSI